MTASILSDVTIGPAIFGAGLGFACAWTGNRAETWSGTPSRLLAALERVAPVADLGVRLSPPVEAGLKAAHVRRAEGRWVTQWRHGGLTRAMMGRQLVRGVQGAKPDAVVMIQDLAILDVPYLVVQDLSYEVLAERYGDRGVPHFPGLSRGALRRLQNRQEGVYESAATLLPMSAWLGRRLVAAGVPANRVVPVHPGLNITVPPDAPVPERPRERRRLLFIGRDAHTKALDQVVESVAGLRRCVDPRITLTVAGPPVWPLRGGIPPGVDYLGPIGRHEVAALMDSHDLFVMPSRLEGFGIVFAEALSRGLPCIGRDDFAMPEIIQVGTGGALIDRDGDVEQLVEVIEKTLGDDGLYDRCAAAAPEIRRHYTWERAAAEVRAAVDGVLN